MTAKLAQVIAVMRVVEEDIRSDVLKLDQTPFDPSGVGETFGVIFAELRACAVAVRIIAEHVGTEATG
jgi:hypothetical protein